MSGGQASVPVTYLLSAAGWRPAWGAQHSDQLQHVRPPRRQDRSAGHPADAYGLLVSAIRDDDPVLVFAPIAAHGVREDVAYADLAPVPLGVSRVHREGSDVSVVAVGHLVHDALAVADDLADEISVEIFDPRTIYPFDWSGLAASLDKTGRLIVMDDSNRFCGLAAEILATVAEQIRLVAPPRRVTRPDSAVLGYVPELDMALQPGREQLAYGVRAQEHCHYQRPAPPAMKMTKSRWSIIPGDGTI